MSALTLRRLLQTVPEDRVRAALVRWSTQEPNGHPAVDLLAEAMESQDLVETRLQELPKKLADLLDVFLADPAAVRSLHTLFQEHGSAFRSRFDLEASLAALEREGFLFRQTGAPKDDSHWAIPGELSASILTLRRRQQSEIRETVTLKGFLDARYFQDRGGAAPASEEEAEKAAAHARKIFKFYLMEASVRNRVRQLPDGVREVFLETLTHHGGICPVADLEDLIDGDEPLPDIDLIKKCLEEGMLGTVAPLRLARFGIQPVERAVILFHEIVLVGLPLYSSVHGVEVDAALCSGVDTVTNVGRFLRDLQSSKVQYTVEGDLYKASQKRIARGLLEIPGGFMPAETQIRFIFSFCKARRLIDRSGERALRPTPDGLGFERLELQDKLKSLLTYAIEEKGLPGEHYHQVRLRRLFLRLLKRSEPEQWHEIQFLPLLARNSYVAQLEQKNIESFFAARFKGGGYTPTEDLQQICWNLLLFVKRRLYPLGLVDLGLRDGRPVALRLSRLGAELLADESSESLEGARSSVVVNPDFEVILFPGHDEHQAVYEFDRFATRLKTDHIHHFRLSRESVQAGLRDGLTLAHVLEELQGRSRAPLPQNVLYSLEEWADLAGLLILDEDGRLRGRREDVLDRFAQLAQVRDHVLEKESATCLRMGDVPWDEIDPVLRELGFLIDRTSVNGVVGTDGDSDDEAE